MGYNKYHNNCLKDAVLFCSLNSMTSFVSGFAVFSVAGFMSHSTGIAIEDLQLKGPGLAFIAYPTALSMTSAPTFLNIVFFVTIFFVGLDSQFINIEGFVTALQDHWPGFFNSRFKKQMLL